MDCFDNRSKPTKKKTNIPTPKLCLEYHAGSGLFLEVICLAPQENWEVNHFCYAPKPLDPDRRSEKKTWGVREGRGGWREQKEDTLYT